MQFPQCEQLKARTSDKNYEPGSFTSNKVESFFITYAQGFHLRGGTQYLRGHSPPPFESQSPPPRKFFARRALCSSEFCLGLLNIDCFFTEVSHNLVQTTSYILKPPAYREACGVSLSRQDHAPFPPLVDRFPPLMSPP